jgi:hypothetical protein
MSAALILLAASAASGFSIGTSFSWFAIVVSSVALAGLSAVVLQIAGFDALPGIAIIAGCLSVHQIAYTVGVAFADYMHRRKQENHARLPRQGT